MKKKLVCSKLLPQESYKTYTEMEDRHHKKQKQNYQDYCFQIDIDFTLQLHGLTIKVVKNAGTGAGR